MDAKRIAQRISMIAAYSEGRLCAPFRFDGYTDSNAFKLWLEQCLLPEQVIILAQVGFHKSAKTQDLISSAKCHLLFLPPYSPT